MRSKQIILAITALAAVSLAGCAPRAAAKPETVSVPLAEPVHVQALRYTELFAGKPFAEALLVYRANGSYTILSEGEDHHGSFVAPTDVRNGPEEVDFISWPSSDWDDNVARHTLSFDATTHRFRQELRQPADPEPKYQAGYFEAVAVDDLGDDRDWRTLRERLASSFDRLAALAGSGEGTSSPEPR